MTLTICNDLSPAQWLIDSALPWDVLVGFGPEGFDSHARLRFIPDPVSEGQSECDVDTGGPTDEAGLVARLCALLAAETSTPDDAYFGLWEGWPGAVEISGGAPRIEVPNRRFYLFKGPLAQVGEWSRSTLSPTEPAAFVWPADHAWCIACDVDPHWAGIGGRRRAIDRLVDDDVLDIVRADPHAPQPAYYG
ncbi:hypothetical protein HH308_15925 [Gordonia sp. TBRC 11910]|uniref:Uncharacterized protein n=1 Tax=Gordonia asplenii TaxID=2725283 RepID=A0A848L2E2_9ACTN|nr:hypothetical protein [Gordonia asplenii]NMO02701.1 hypothetical protein [Gordonia asplenii]